MAKGKQTCKILKEIRKQIAEENDINLVIEECTYKGDCLGTCPRCEAEVRYLERELEKRQRMGKVAVIAGLSLGTMLTASSCSHLGPQVTGRVPATPDPPATTLPTDTTDPDGPYLLEGDVLAPEPDTIEIPEPDSAELLEPDVVGKDEEEKKCEKQDGKIPVVGENDSIEVSPIEGYVVGTLEQELEEPDVWSVVEEMPEFPGGWEKLNDYIVENLNYPQKKKEQGIQGKVFVRFIIEPDGSISNTEILRSVDSELDAEALRVVESMPKWNPGKHRGRAVRVSCLLPIHFKLD